VLYNQLQEHLNKYSILAEEQFGFISDSTANKAIYKLINETLNALNSKFVVGGIFFYLEKDFDCLNHNILLSKLQFHGVNGKSKSWFESYLVIVIVIYLSFHKIHTDIEAVINKINSCVTFTQ
jgi:hypothetical protein